jgi:SAM-dependent methyltransferase
MKKDKSNVIYSSKNTIINDLDNSVKTRLYDLFNKTKSGYEFEFIFFTIGGPRMQQDKYVKLIKLMNKRVLGNKNFTLIKPIDTLDISYRKDPKTVFRCTIHGKENINTIMKKMEHITMLKNHVVLKTLAKMYKHKEFQNQIHFMKKIKIDDPVDITDFNFRGVLSDESDLTKEELTELIKLDETTSDNISFRYKQRTTIYILGKENTSTLIKIDLTESKSAKYYNQLNKLSPNYELELEYNTDKPKEEHYNIMMDEALFLLKIVNQSNFILSTTKANEVLSYYKNITKTSERATNLDGRQPITLELRHTVEEIANKYAVTDKADGERHFLITYNNRCYLISNNLNVKDTGIILAENKLKYNGSILDGEYIFIPHKNRHIFLAFDCLFYCGTDIRLKEKLFDRLENADDIIEKCFILGDQKGVKYQSFTSKNEFILDEYIAFYENDMKKSLKILNADIEIEKKYPLIRRKYFIGALGAKPWEIFAYASAMWSVYTESSLCPYLLDGLILQPLVQPYITNVNEINHFDFKWKTPQSNSFDFYIEFETDKNGDIIIAYDNSYADEIDGFSKNKPYKIAKLHVGMTIGKVEKPVLFKENESLCYAHLYLDRGEVRDIEGNIISNKTVVEFYYNTNDGVLDMYRWVPMRTRHDKTDSVNRLKRKYGNYTTVADKIWKSVINPTLMTNINDLAMGNDPKTNNYMYDKTMDKLRSKIGKTDIIQSSKDSYYQITKKKSAENMRQWMNFIKDKLIWTYCTSLYANKTVSVLDFGCGTGGDIKKFYYAKIGFYVGFDIDNEGIINSTDGAISRYNDFKKNKPGFPPYHFMQADGGLELDPESQIGVKGMNSDTQRLLGKFFSKDPKKRTMFDVINCQFAIHYMFETVTKWENLMKNVNNYLRTNGHFLITCFDADKIIKLLEDKDSYRQEYTDENGKTKILFEIIKKYNLDNHKKDTMIGTGHAIDVYMTWAFNDGVFRTEYLVDSKFIVKELKEKCGLILVDTDSFQNQLIQNEKFLLNEGQYESKAETRKYFTNTAKFYESNSTNDGCKIWNNLMRYYVFEKQSDPEKRKISRTVQKGGNLSTESDVDELDFTDTSKFIAIPLQSKINKTTCLESIHHIMKNNGVIPKTLGSNTFFDHMNIKIIEDINLEYDHIKNIGKNIIIDHTIENEESGRKKIETVLNGIHIFLIERNCNDDFEIDLVQKSEKINNNDKAIILMKEGHSYVPVYKIDENDTRIGILSMSDNVVKAMLKEI